MTAVPTAMAIAAAIPMVNMPWDRAKTRIKIDPEQGLIPAAITAAIAPRKPEPAAATGAWLCPQCSSCT